MTACCAWVIMGCAAILGRRINAFFCIDSADAIVTAPINPKVIHKINSAQGDRGHRLPIHAWINFADLKTTGTDLRL